MKYDPMSRRLFLQGLGGITLGIPLLSSLLPLTARAQSATPPLRFVFVGGRYGRKIEAWYPANDPTNLSTDGVYYAALGKPSDGPISQILGTAFDPVRSKMSLLRGLDAMQINGDAHVSAVPLTASGYASTGIGFGYSLDAVLEESPIFYPIAPMISALRTNPSGNNNLNMSFSYTSKAGVSQVIAADWDPAQIYLKYFDATTTQKTYKRSLREKSITNAVMDDFKSVMNSNKISSADKYQLESHIALLSQAEIKLGVTPITCASAKNPAGAFTTAEQLHSAVIDMEVAALACGMTKIVCHSILQGNSEIITNEGEDHSAAHNGVSSQAESNRSPVDQAVLNNWSMARVAEFMTKLDAVNESNGTLLDNTIFLYGNCDSRGFHNFYDQPAIIAGGKNKLRTGYYIDYRPRPFTVVDTSHSALIAGRPYNNLLVTIFKAIGLGPSDYQKFGQSGFGVYDKFDISKLSAHYAPFLGSHVNDTLPFLSVG